MDQAQLKALSPQAWQVSVQAVMRVPALIYGNRDLVQDMDVKVLQKA